MRPLFRRSMVLALVAARAGAQTPPPDAGRFMTFAQSSAVLQERAAGFAASRDTRPEVKAFAAEMQRFRQQQIPRLQAAAQARGVTLPAAEEFEHRVVLENLEPLDYLALSRRYAEVQVQALEQEIRGYEAAVQAPDEGLRQWATDLLPQLRQWLEAARRVHDGVKP